jgi:predicted metal-dependent hydrolase
MITKSRTIDIAGVGPVLLERSKRAKHVVIYVRPVTGIRVAVPGRLSFKYAEEFVHARMKWIQKQLKRMQQYKKVSSGISAPSTGLERAQAKKMITERLAELAKRYGFSYNRVFLRNQKTRWGSCSHSNNISLNIKLAGLPVELMDYVILHELVHTRYKNHGKVFWDELDKFVADSRSIARQLRRYMLETL